MENLSLSTSQKDRIVRPIERRSSYGKRRFATLSAIDGHCRSRPYGERNRSSTRVAPRPFAQLARSVEADAHSLRVADV